MVPPTDEEATPPILLHDYFELSRRRTPDATALVCGDARLTYADLDRRANQLAALLRRRGVATGDTVGILLERSVETYVAILGALKAGAAYVPLDPSFPDDRVAFIAEDSAFGFLLTSSALAGRASGLGCAVLAVDQLADECRRLPDTRPEVGVEPSSPAYVIYTSGSTGKPKGVVISHASIVNFLRVATPIYGVTARDRVYQGMSISFDFHLEEIWPAWAAGAALVAGPTDARRFGQALADFLTEHGVTVFCAVPTLLTTIETEPETVRTLLVSGEAMPPDLVRRWWRPDRRVLNCYGPTEATVSASCCELSPDRPVTLGTPFPTYVFYVLDEQLRPVPDGETGEICIGGPGLAVGYLNREELTAERFLPNPVVEDRATVPLIYRTGDLGRVTPTGEYEYLGRIDTQVKIRGYRVELGEIEQVIREDPEVENAVVALVDRDNGAQDLVGYLTLSDGAAGDDHTELRERLHATLRRRLPSYMVPSHIEVLDEFPLLAAGKVNRARLPAPASPPLGARLGPHVEPESDLERRIAEAWEPALGAGKVSVTADFFTDLGGHSLAAARAISLLRREPAFAGLSMGDLYAHPTVRSLARYVETELAPAQESEIETVDWPAPIRHSSLRFFLCGLAQLVLLYTYILALGLPAIVLGCAVELKLQIWTLAPATSGPLAVLERVDLGTLALVCVLWFVATLFVVPVVVGRLLLSGIRPGWHRMWGRTYLLFWFYGKVAALAPLNLLAGTPLLPRYLRLLGARIGHGCHLSTATIALPRFVEIGERSSIGTLARIQPYAVQAGWLRIAPIRIGSGCYVGASTVVLPGSEIGDGASVDHQSLVHADQRIPEGEHWAGSPSRRMPGRPVLLQAVLDREPVTRWRPVLVVAYALAAVVLRVLPWVMYLPSLILALYAAKQGGLGWAVTSVLVGGPLQVLVTCLSLVALKRAVLRSVKPGVYPWRSWFGWRQWFAERLHGMTLTLLWTVYCTLYVIPLLRGFGMRLGRWAEVATPAFVEPDQCEIGDKSFLAAGVILAPPVCHNGFVAVAPARMDDFSFLGNTAQLPCGAHLGRRSLLGVQSVPPEKPVEPETTWLGSPSFFLPRRQESPRFDQKLIDTPTPGMVAARLVIEYFRVCLPGIITLLGATLAFYTTIALTTAVPLWGLLLLGPLLWWATGLFNTLLVVLLKWLVMGRYRPRTEPYWGLWVRGTEFITGLYQAVVVRSLLAQFWGTPWAAPVLRMFGVRVGRRVWLNGGSVTEFDLVSVGDDAMVGEFSDLQTHLFEDRVMKMSWVRVEEGATVGTAAVVLYDSVVGRGTYLDAFSLAMKGESLPAGTRWRGIPARPL
nr:non-ribosomal peptide synthetase [Streptoalloteichus tenebrarius]